MSHPTGDSVRQQVGQDVLDRGVRLAEKPARSSETRNGAQLGRQELSGYVSSVTIEHPGG